MKNIIKTPVFLIFIFLFSSCIKHVDFEQIGDLTAEPIFKTSLVYFTLNQVVFFDRINSLEIVTPINKTSDFLSLNSSFVRKNLIKAEIEFEITNEFDRDFTVDFQFLDDNNVVTHTLQTFNITANNLKYLHKETIVVSGNQQFLSSTKIRVFVQLSQNNNGAAINPAIEKKLVFKTAGTFFLKI
ncbi:hypothetical protein KCTC32516_00244 [Polaribacter huanghezhanensis]|uniref:hypothetical protein n=1 Tax=Polaribacter huanghezhanensis TaxID=1354726 RepID=UPI002649A84B|nr:hypothetical protein [Polaribacter huanghezhanensis]WKD84908.1 hypothetical protein KCTC32516_00244 [Polaribacter huanghezhanensis]